MTDLCNFLPNTYLYAVSISHRSPQCHRYRRGAAWRDAGTIVNHGQTEKLPKIWCCGTNKAEGAPYGEAAWREVNKNTDQLLNESQLATNQNMISKTSHFKLTDVAVIKASTDSSAPLVWAHCYHRTKLRLLKYHVCCYTVTAEWMQKIGNI